MIYDWCEERLEIQSIADDIISKLVPPHVNIFYCFGGLILTCLIIQSGTFIGLTIYYRPTVFEQLSFGVTGYSLSWDQIGYWACAIVTTIPEALKVLYPSIGKIVIMTLRGSDTTSQSTLTRLYSIHTFVLPLMITISCIIHFSMLRKQGISGPL